MNLITKIKLSCVYYPVLFFCKICEMLGIDTSIASDKTNYQLSPYRIPGKQNQVLFGEIKKETDREEEPSIYEHNSKDICPFCEAKSYNEHDCLMHKRTPCLPGDRIAITYTNKRIIKCEITKPSQHLHMTCHNCKNIWIFALPTRPNK